MKKWVTPVPVKKFKKPNIDWNEDLDVSEHGGECCGRQHLFGFDEVNPWGERSISFGDKMAGILDFIKYHIGTGNSGKGWCVEVVLNEKQTKEWERALQAVGFKKVFSFVNVNSGNECFVYLADTSKLKG